jgi:hypothetical protein
MIVLLLAQRQTRLRGDRAPSECIPQCRDGRRAALLVERSDQRLNRESIGDQVVAVKGLQDGIAGCAAVLSFTTAFGTQFDAAKSRAAFRAYDIALSHARLLFTLLSLG